MKSVLLYIADDEGFEARFQAALDLTRSLGGHLHCLRVNPYNSQVAFDGVTGISVMYDVSQMSRELDEKLRAEIEKRLADEDVSWDYREENADPARGLSKNSSLVDIIVLSSASQDKDNALPLGILGDVLFNATAPVIVQPDDVKKFDACGAALVAWNGSFEAGNALRAAVPLLRSEKCEGRIYRDGRLWAQPGEGISIWRRNTQPLQKLPHTACCLPLNDKIS